MTLYIIIDPTLNAPIFTDPINNYIYKRIIHKIPKGNITFSDNKHCYRHVCAAMYIHINQFNKLMNDTSTRNNLFTQLLFCVSGMDHFTLIIDGDLYKEYNIYLPILHKWMIEISKLKVIVIPSDSHKQLYITEKTILDLFTNYKKLYGYFYDILEKPPHG